MYILNNVVVFKVNNLDISCSPSCIHIQDSYKVRNKKEMEEVLKIAEDTLIENCVSIDTPFNHRTKRGMVREWVSHNNAYILGYKQSQTGSVDLEYPQKWYMKILYFILSRVVL